MRKDKAVMFWVVVVLWFTITCAIALINHEQNQDRYEPPTERYEQRDAHRPTYRVHTTPSSTAFRRV